MQYDDTLLKERYRNKKSSINKITKRVRGFYVETRGSQVLRLSAEIKTEYTHV